MTTAEIATIDTRALVRDEDAEWSVERMIAQTTKIQQCMKAVMKEGEHYGVIPGTNTKPTLLKPGAEKLCLMFRLDPEYDIVTSVETSERIAFTIRCTLTHIPTGQRIASGLGSCNSREAKYLRPAPKKCPKCSKETIFKSKQDTGGWYCWAKKGGCGAQYKDGDEAIEKQDNGLADPADLHNTILKMGCKRALVAAVLNGTAASDFFGQDLEDLTEKAAEYTPPAKQEAPQDGPKAPTSASTASAGTVADSVPASKPPRADTVKHSNVFAGDIKVARLVQLATTAGTYCKGGCAVEVQQFSKRAGSTVPKVKLCTFHAQLAAFKGPDGKPCETPNELSEEQADNLIGRYEAKLARQELRSADVPHLDIAPKPTLQDAIGQHMEDEDAGRWLHGYFGKSHVQELTPDEATTAFALLAVFGDPDAYDQLETKARALGKLR